MFTFSKVKSTDAWGSIFFVDHHSSFISKYHINSHKHVCMHPLPLDSNDVISYNKNPCWLVPSVWTGSVSASEFHSNASTLLDVDPACVHNLCNLKIYLKFSFETSRERKLRWQLANWDYTGKRLLCRSNNIWRLGSLVAKALDLQLEGCEFNSQPRHCRVTTLGKLCTPRASAGRSGLAMAWLTAVWEAAASYVYHDNHCEVQPWAWAAHPSCSA